MRRPRRSATRPRRRSARAETGAAFNRRARAPLEWRQNNLRVGDAFVADRRGPARLGVALPARCTTASLMTLTRPALAARAPGLAFRPDGEHLAVAGGNPFGRRRDGTEPSEVSVWDVRTGPQGAS
ncbi:MAG: hypothetical protein U0797_17220 [Gemmataceae bacterium]